MAAITDTVRLILHHRGIEFTSDEQNSHPRGSVFGEQRVMVVWSSLYSQTESYLNLISTVLRASFLFHYILILHELSSLINI